MIDAENASKDAAYKAEYDKAATALDEAEKSTTSRAPNGQFTKVEPEAPAADKPAEAVVAEPAKTEDDPMVALLKRLENTEKALKDTQAWGTQRAQETADLKREVERERHERSRPKLLEANPELEEVVRYIQSAPSPQQEAENTRHQNWLHAVEKAVPGIFSPSIDPELQQAVMDRRAQIGDEWLDPLVAIREINEIKGAINERQVGKRFAAEAAKLAQKSAMSVPGAGGTVSGGPGISEVDRIRNMTDAEFAKEVRKVQGY